MSLTLALLLWPEIRQPVLLCFGETKYFFIQIATAAAAVHFLLFQCTLIALFSHSFASFTDSRRSTVCFVKCLPKTNLMQIYFRYFYSLLRLFPLRTIDTGVKVKFSFCLGSPIEETIVSNNRGKFIAIQTAWQPHVAKKYFRHYNNTCTFFPSKPLTKNAAQSNFCQLAIHRERDSHTF